MRKTVSVDQIRSKINHTLLHSPDDYRQGREALQMFLEGVLMEAGRYSGFRYLTPDDMLSSESGVSWGINPVPDHFPADGWNQFDGSDPTRVEYLG